MKRSLWIGLLWAAFGGALAFAQEPVDPFEQANTAAFAGVDKSQVPSGIWSDYGVDLIDLNRFRGTLSDSNYVDIHQFRRIYASLQSSTVNGNAPSFFLNLDSFNDRVDRLPYRQNPYDQDTILIPILHLQYHGTRADAVNQNLFRVSSDNKVFDVAGRSQSPYELRYAFAAGPELPYSRRATVSFGFTADCFVTNTGKTLSQLEADFGNGAGLQTVGLNSITQVAYSGGGEKIIRIRLTYTDGTVAESRSRFVVIADPGNPNARYAVPGRNDVLTPTYQVNPTFSRAGGNIFVRLSTQNPTGHIRRPLIVVEGYDAGRFFPESSYTLFDFLSSVNGTVFDSGLNFNAQLDEVGQYDLIFVDYQDGTADIRQNAAMVEEVIRLTNVEKNANGSTEGNVVMGLSMGGLVARYALCEMASQNMATQTRLLITHDSPHQGANVPLSLQALVNDIQSLRIYGVRVASLVPSLGKAVDLINAPASQQLLIIQDGRTNTFLNNEYRAMISQSIPGCRLVAVANGSQCGQSQLLQPLGEILRIDANLYVNWLTWGVASAVGNAIIGVITLVPVVGPLIAFPASLLFNTAMLVITPFVGKNWIFNVNCRALPNQQVQQVFSGRLQAEKRFLGLFRLYSITIWDKSRNSSADMLPWDSVPGGVYNLSGYQAQLPGNPNINAFPFLSVNLNINLASGFCFVPTVSALDITTVNATTVYDRYNSGTSPSNPSRFASFIAQEQVAGSNPPRFNTDHIAYTARNSQWIFNEMQGLPNTVTCTNECPIPGVSVSGPDLVCTTGTYTLNPTPASATVSWSTSDGNRLAIDANTGAANAGTSGVVNVVATINGCANNTVSKSVRTGGYSSSDYPVTGPSSAQCNQDVYYSTNELPAATNYQWVYPNDWTYVSGQGSRYLTVRTSNNSGGVGVRVANACDAGGSPALVFTNVSCGYYGYRVSPNPAQTQLSLLFDVKSEDGNFPERIELYTENDSRMVMSAETAGVANRSSARQVTIDVSKLARGRYVMHIVRESDKDNPVDRLHIELN